jgi:hypothetical protein
MVSVGRFRSSRSASRWFAALLVVAALLTLTAVQMARADFTKERKFSAEQHDDWEPHIAADDDGHVYWATTRYGGRKACKACPDPAVVYRISNDGGATWSTPRFICRCPGVGGQHDPVLATDDSGRVFFTWMNDFEVNFARSDDFGVTWTRHGALDGARRYSDKPWIGVSNDGEDVYITFNADGKSPGAPYTVYSHNAGATWSPPILGRRNELYWFAGGVTVTPDGTVFSSQDAYPQNYEGQIVLFVLRSEDGGRSWDTIGIDRSREQRQCPDFAGCPKAFFGPQIAVASDDNGRVYVLWNASKKKAGLARLYLRWSDDNGETWSLPRDVAPKPHVDHEFPTLAATGAGDVAIAWMDNRTGRWNTFYKRSSDGGETWSATQRLSNAAGGAPYKSARGFRFPYGDYGGIAIDGDGTAHVTWGESRSYIGPGGSWYARGL